MIKRASFRHFKCLSDVELDGLGQLGVFVGPNGSGKTSILEGLHYISQLGAKRPRDLFVGQRAPETLLERGADKAKMYLGASGTWLDEDGSVSLQIQSESGHERDDSRHDYHLEADWKSGDFQSDRHAINYEKSNRPFAYALDSAVFLRLDPEKLADPSYSEEETPRVEYNGEGLATVVRELQASRNDDFERLVELLAEIVPVVEGVRTRRAPVRKTSKILLEGMDSPKETVEKFMGEELLFDMKGAKGIPAHAASEGTLLVLGLLAIIFNERRPSLVLLDDIEQSLHPKALGDLIEVLRRLLDEYDDMQILATSHSPYLLDHLEADEIWLTNLDEGGHTVARRLDEHPEFDEWRDEMSPGEFWSYVGEDWLTDSVQ